MLHSLRDTEYRPLFVAERLRSSVALQIRALRQERNMTQAQLGDAIGMAQTWISKLEDPDYGKMTVATLLRLAQTFDTDIEIKFRPFSKMLDTIPIQGPEYFHVQSFEKEFGLPAAENISKVQDMAERSGIFIDARKQSSALALVPSGVANARPEFPVQGRAHAFAREMSSQTRQSAFMRKKPGSAAASLIQEKYATD
jgi:transcriptional regulator with XRE-family HTH domain